MTPTTLDAPKSAAPSRKNAANQNPHIAELRRQRTARNGDEPNTLWLVPSNSQYSLFVMHLRNEAYVLDALEEMSAAGDSRESSIEDALGFAAAELGVRDVVVCGCVAPLSEPRGDLVDRVRGRQSSLAAAKRNAVAAYRRLRATGLDASDVQCHCSFHLEECGALLCYDEKLGEFVLEPDAE